MRRPPAPTAAAEDLPAGTETIRNAVDDPIVLLIAGLTRVGEPFTTVMTGMEMGGTPAAATPSS